MPEWPELEHYRKQLSTLISGHKISGITVNRESSINESAEAFEAALAGRTILFVERRGKHLLFHLDDGNRLHLDLMATGWLAYGNQDEKADGEIQVIIRLSDGNSLSVGGMRNGYLHRTSAKEIHGQMKRLGPEPFDARLTLEAFRKRLSGKKGKLKSTLMDQKFIAGIGSIYSDEIGFHAQVHPGAAVGDLDSAAIERLFASMRTVLMEAKEAGGCIARPLTQFDTVTGGYIGKLQVYGREGERCGRCGSDIRQETITGRKMFFCPQCQPLTQR